MTEVLRINVRVDEALYPTLAHDLAGKPARSRAERLRSLAQLGVLVEQGQVQAAAALAGVPSAKAGPGPATEVTEGVQSTSSGSRPAPEPSHEGSTDGGEAEAQGAAPLAGGPPAQGAPGPATEVTEGVQSTSSGSRPPPEPSHEGSTDGGEAEEAGGGATMPESVSGLGATLRNQFAFPG